MEDPVAAREVVHAQDQKCPEASRLGLSQRQIALSCAVGQATVSDYLGMAAAAGLKWPDIAEWDDDRLRAVLGLARSRRRPGASPTSPTTPRSGASCRPTSTSPCNCSGRSTARSSPTATATADTVSLYRNWLKRQEVVLRQEHRAGEKLFVDYAGDTIPVHDPATGEVRAAAIFVAVLGASNYTYAEATWTQGLADWIGAHLRAFEFVGGMPEIVVPDNLKSGVTKPAATSPDLNRTYEEMASHYGVAVMPARPHETARQGQSGSRRFGGRAMDPGGAAKAKVLLARRSQPGHRGTARAASTTGRSANAKAHAAACLKRSTSRLCAPCLPSDISTATGPRPASTSTIT